MMFVKLIAETPWALFVVMCLTLGLAPYNPPHIVEKLQMLLEGTLVKPVDIFDLLMHSTPWALLTLKILISIKK